MRFVIIDDESKDRKLIINFLKKEFPHSTFFEVAEKKEFEKILETKEFDITIMDYKLSWGDGIQILKQIKAKNPDCGVIMFTAAGNERIAVEAMKAGLDDYIIKSREHFINLIPAIHSALKNIEERKKREEAEKRFRKLAEMAMEAIIITDSKGKIIFWNKAAEELFGYKKGEIIEKEITTIIPSWGKKYINEHLAKVKEEIMIRNDGKEFLAEISLTSWKSDNKYFFGYIIRDITEKKKAEEEIRKLADLYYSIGMIINGSDTIEDLCNRLLNSIKEVIEVDMVNIYIFDEKRNVLQPIAYLGFPDELAKIIMVEREIKKDQPWESVKACISKKERYVKNLQEYAQLSFNKEFYIKYDLKELYTIPLLTKNKLHGILQVAMTTKNKLTELKKRLLKSISEEIAAGIAKIKAQEEMKIALEKEKEFKRRTAHYFLNPLCIAKGYLSLALEENNNKYIIKAIEALKRIEKVILNIVRKGEIKD